MKIYLYDGSINRHSGLIVWVCDFLLRVCLLFISGAGLQVAQDQQNRQDYHISLCDFAHLFAFQKIKVLSPIIF